MGVLLLEMWFEYRRDLVVWSREEKFPMSWIYWILSLFSRDVSERAVKFDMKAVRTITIIGIPSAFLLHGYVGFIFGSVKANPWWSSVLMPIVFLMSAIVSGIALVIVLYMVLIPLKGGKIDMKCLDTLTSYLFYAVIVDFSLEALDFIHRLYESEESIQILGVLIADKLLISLVVIQILLGMLIPAAILVAVKSMKFDPELRKLLYFVSAILIQIGIFSTRWNVVIGGQLFSKSFRGLTTYKMEVMGVEGLLVALVFLILPFIILGVLVKMLPPWKASELGEAKTS
jgi:Ni/Fe-hydrogenase subunit HybB-like protein